MAKKKIQKAPKGDKAQEDHSDHEPAKNQPQDPPKNDEPKEEPASHKKAGRKGKSKQTEHKDVQQKDVELFPQEFRSKLNDFKSFYNEYLQMRASSSDVDQASQFKKVSDSIRTKIDQACAKVLQEEVVDAQKWIEEQKTVTKEQIKNVQKAEADTRSALQKSGTFSAAQIDSQLSTIRKKKESLQSHLKGLDDFKGRANGIYKSNHSIDEQ